MAVPLSSRNPEARKAASERLQLSAGFRPRYNINVRRFSITSAASSPRRKNHVSRFRFVIHRGTKAWFAPAHASRRRTSKVNSAGPRLSWAEPRQVLDEIAHQVLISAGLIFPTAKKVQLSLSASTPRQSALSRATDQTYNALRRQARFR